MVRPISSSPLSRQCFLNGSTWNRIAPVRAQHDLLFQIHRKAGVGAELGVLHQLLANLLGQHDGQDAVLEAVVEEDVGEARAR